MLPNWRPRANLSQAGTTVPRFRRQYVLGMTPQLGPHLTPDGLSGPNQISKVILDYAASIQGAQSEDDLLVLNAGLARDISGADRCSIWLVDEQKRELWTKVA